MPLAGFCQTSVCTGQDCRKPAKPAELMACASHAWAPLRPVRFCKSMRLMASWPAGRQQDCFADML
jgi:hypothetical protein